MIYTYTQEDKERFEPLFHQGVTLLNFTAPWCGTCRMVKRSMKEIDARENINFLEIDVDQHKELMKAFKIQGVPVCILLKDGAVIDRTSGSLNYEEFMAWLGKHDLGGGNR